MKSFALLAAAAATLSIPAVAQEAHRELGPHVHGHGTLNIAIENKRVSMELEVPGMDIVGFEHEAESKEQKAAVSRATAQLRKALSVFKLPSAAGCKVAEADVKIHKEEHEDHDEHAEAKADGEQTAKKEHEHEEHGGHNEFHVAYALDCSEPSRITSIQFDYFKLFKGANGLTVNIVTAKGQSTYEVTREKPVLDLAGMI
jgi:hypothetical protein